ncbi:hypothetical protein WJX72_003773 [[Myrmecia] bisecta]|uniref:Glutathione S-transferase n=1 Tax=[Myrmecia] bisecta TaxID=41462 RepID=A0AAW1PGK2_9CHLO
MASPPAPDITVVHAPGARSVQIIWLVEELGLQYKIVQVELTKRKPAEHRALSPLGLVPAFKDHDTVLSESGAILQYLLQCFGNGRLQPPIGTQEASLLLQWCWFAEASLTNLLSDIALHTKLLPAKMRVAEVVPFLKARTAQRLAYVEGELQGKDHILGQDFTAADIMLGYTITQAKHIGLLSEPQHPNLVAYVERLHRRPACQKAFAGVVSRL